MKTLDHETAIKRSYQLLALLDVCERGTRGIGDMGVEDKLVRRYAGSMADVLKLASEIANEIHGVLETPPAAEPATA